MEDLSLKTHYSVYELAELNLKSLPTAPKNIAEKAKRENWQSQPRKGRGGGIEYALASLPEDIQTEIRNKFAVSIVNKKVSVPVVRNEDVSSLNAKQREIADARMALVACVAELEQSMSRIKAVTYFCEQAKCGQLSAELIGLVEIANAKKGKSGRVLSVRSLNQWVIDYHKANNAEERLQALAPAQRKAKKAEELAWLPDFLAVYRNTNGVNISEAYHEFAYRWQMQFADQPLLLERLPSIGQVRRGLAKLPKLIKEIGRKTGAELRALNTYVKRDWSVLRANDVWVGDGHSMKMKVQHPDHGRPFIPEVTLIMDTASRYIVGWSVSLAENCLAVADALRCGIERHGIPAIYYSDNGGGEKNWMLDGDITGMLPRLGINHQTGIPGNPQGRGIIERVNKTLLLRIARQFETYHGGGADRETVRKTGTAIISLDKALRQRKTELTPKQQSAVGKLPSWKQFVDAVEEGVRWYNEEHIHREIGTTPARKRAELLKGVDVLYVTPVEARDMFRPQVIRTAQRGWVSVFNNDYFNQQLINVDGEKVAVSFDIHNAETVIIRRLDGSYICDGIWDGNKRDAFPRTFVEKAREERYQRRIKLKQAQVDEINAELNPVINLEHNTSTDLLHGLRTSLKKAAKAEDIAVLPSELRRKQA